jgi:hypothetical protein
VTGTFGAAKLPGMQLKTLAAALSLAALVAACGSENSEYEKAENSPAPEATVAKEVKAKGDRPDADGNGVPDVITVKGKLGDRLELQGSGLNDNVNDHTKTDIRVTLKGVRGPFKGYDIAADRKLIGLELRFTNSGQLEYSDPQPDGTLSLDGGETGKQTNLITLGGKEPCENNSVKLREGQSKDTCIVFEVPKSGKLEAFQYITDSGFGDTGLWAL